MIKTTCTCDRCGKEFLEEESKTIIIKKAVTERRKGSEITRTDFSGNVLNNLKKFLIGRFVRDYCPDCVTKFKEFLNMKGENDNENSSDKH